MDYKMQLNEEELDILDGKQGEILQKIMKTLIRYGDIFNAKKLVSVTAPSHFLTSFGMPEFEGMYEILRELIKNGVKTKLPFTVNPKPFDLTNVNYSGGQKGVFKKQYSEQTKLEDMLTEVGLKDKDLFTCACYLEQTQNIPKYGNILSWSNPSTVIYSNSVLGARTNNNPAVIDLFGAILGKVPEFGYLTDEGRKAPWNVVLNTRNLPNVQILAHAIAKKTGGQTPYIQGIDSFLGRRIDEDVQDYLKDLGAVMSTSGMGLFHVDHLTPEAVEHGKKLLSDEPNIYIVDDEELNLLQISYPIPWKKSKQTPKACLIGCPHLTLNQIERWSILIDRALKMHGKAKVAIPVYLSCAPDVYQRFKANYTLFNKVINTGIQLTAMCPLAYMNNSKCGSQPIVTNSNVLRTYSNVRYYDDQELSSVIATGRCQ